MNSNGMTTPNAVTPRGVIPNAASLRVAIMGDGALARAVRTAVESAPHCRAVDDWTQADVVVHIAEEQDPSGPSVLEVLSQGRNVVTTHLPPDGDDAVREACRRGQSTVHATGGAAALMISQFSRAFTGITREISSVYVVGRSDQPGDPELAAELLAESVSPAGSDVVSDLAFETGTDPQNLELRVSITSRDAVSHATIHLQARSGEAAHAPALRLATRAIMRALGPVQASAPGVLRYDVDINHVRADGRLA